MIRNALLLVEVRDGKLKRISRQILNYFSQLEKLKVNVLIYRDHIDQEMVDEISGYNVDRIYAAEHEYLKEYNPEILTDCFKKIIDEIKPDCIFACNTALTRDLFPRLAQIYKKEMISDVTDVEHKRYGFRISRPIYGGKIFETIQVKDYPMFITTRANTFEEGLPREKKDVEIIHLDMTEYNNKNLTYIVKDVVERTETKVPITEAEVVIIGGGGLKKKENFQRLFELADLLDAQVGGTRQVTNAKWLPWPKMVGQSGKRIRPKLYLSFGVSGAMQHTAGMLVSGYVVAVDKYKDARIFDYADFAIVAQAMEILEPLIKRLKEYKKAE